MRLVKIGVAAVSVKVGDFKGNAARLVEAVEAAKHAGVHLLVTPELAVSGYSLEDRIFWTDIARHSWAALAELAAYCDNISVFFGLPIVRQHAIYNAAAMVSDKVIRGLVLKKHLPTYSIFYEGRNWSAWPGGVTEINGVPAGELVFDLPFGRVTAEICEDLWSPSSPARDRVRLGAEIVCNPSASPFTPGKNQERKRLVLGAASSMKCVYAYANLLGSDNSRLVFDGGGLIATPTALVCEGALLSERAWTLATGIVDLDDIQRQRMENTTWRQDVPPEEARARIQMVTVDGPTYKPADIAAFARRQPLNPYVHPPRSARRKDRANELDELFDALALGLRDYYEKVGAFQRYLIALSGGRDSALCLLLAVRAAKMLQEGGACDSYADRVSTVYLPNGPLSSDATHNAAKALAREMGVPFSVLSIAEEAALALEKASLLAGGDDAVLPLTRQNLQARVRGAMMLNWANNCGGLLLVTSNLSEAAVGYSTTGGDNQGGFSPIANVPKTVVSQLLAHVAQRDGLSSIQAILDIPPSAELAPGQQDETDLMPYPVLDAILFLYAKQRLSLANCWRMVARQFPEHSPEQVRLWTADFARRFVASQWKRDQHPVSLKVMDLDLDPKTGFRFPVSQSIQYELDELDAASLDV